MKTLIYYAFVFSFFVPFLGTPSYGQYLRSPFSKIGEIDSVAETATQIIVVDLDLEKLTAQKGSGEGLPYNVIVVDKSNLKNIQIFPANREIYGDGGSRVVEFENGLLYLPVEPGVRGLDDLEKQNSKYLEKGVHFALEPFLYWGTKTTPIRSSSVFPQSESALKILAPIWDGKNPPLIDSLEELTKLRKSKEGSSAKRVCSFLLKKLNFFK